MPIDRSTTLCLACASSLPPYSSSKGESDLFITNCCNRPICPNCTTSNPRLKRYDPCLACLAGVRVVQASSSHKGGRSQSTTADRTVANVDGSVRDQDLFVLGDDDEDALELENYTGSEGHSDTSGDTDKPPSPPPAYSSDLPSKPSPTLVALTVPEPSVDDASCSNEPMAPPEYHIKRGDTLQSIAFRFKVNGFELCKLNNLPRSTLNTTPHLLHTRTSLILPASCSLSPEDTHLVGSPSPSRVAERAGKRLQTVTKEVDWRIAQAYVALAEDEDGTAVKKEIPDYKRPSSNEASGSLEAMAIDRYLDDTEWEASERRAGRGVSLQKFPFGGFGGKDKSIQGGVFKWPWSSF